MVSFNLFYCIYLFRFEMKIARTGALKIGCNNNINELKLHTFFRTPYVSTACGMVSFVI